MYKELEIKFKNGQYMHYSPLDKMKMTKEENIIEITWYGTLSVFSEKWDLNNIEFMKINICENFEVLDSEIIFNEQTCNIREFDNLNNDTYGLLK